MPKTPKSANPYSMASLGEFGILKSTNGLPTSPLDGGDGPRFAVGSLVYPIDEGGILTAPYHAVTVVDVRAGAEGWEYRLAEVDGWRPDHLLEPAGG